jgi:hypothetical protein
MNNYKATPDCWEWQEKWASQEAPDEISSCILELRARVEALEAQGRNYPETPDSSTPPPVSTDEELDKIWNFEDTWNGSLRALYNLGVAHGQTGSREVAEPAPVAGGLVERVSDAITSETGSRWASTEARAAILEVARWLRSHGISGSAKVLEQEAGR